MKVRLAFLILSIIILLDILAAVFSLADFLEGAGDLSKIVLMEEDERKNWEESRETEEIIGNRTFEGQKLFGPSNRSISSREHPQAPTGKGHSVEIKSDSVNRDDLVYLKNATDGEVMNPKEEVVLILRDDSDPFSQMIVFAAEAFGFGIVLIANLTALQGFVFVWHCCK